MEENKFLKENAFYSRIDEDRTFLGLQGKYLGKFFLFFMLHLVGLLIVIFISMKLILLVVISLVFFYKRVKKNQAKYGANGLDKEKKAKKEPKKVKYNAL
jgi:uncharacterized membrane protein